MTPLGPMLAMAEDRGLVLLEFLDRPALAPEIETLRQRHGYAMEPGAHPHTAQVAHELAAYFAGRLRRFTVPVHAPGSEFDLSLWSALQQIPFGETRSYADLARQLRRPGAFRAVGAANGRNRVAIVIPCHRVIGSDGSLTGYGGGQARKAQLIRLEQSVLGVGAAPAATAVDAGCEPAGHPRSSTQAVDRSVPRSPERGAQGGP
jgi:AraC family transcriptional regulator, regulatory protein of adaptative response / methylated-DNA-[protein]-cysteine methyltransferase